ncbi:MAG TPA: TrpB-like pyridoxal phosphate-dependent enzyme [Spirochaetota bacterium]|nr:TrpB-like pyridoxal phosphate-dependent enzyme [Spirochaetota bacterium]
MSQNRSYVLPLSKMPNKWINILHTMPEALTPLVNPANSQPLPVEALLPLFSKALIEQEINTKDEFIEIPEEIQKAYSIYRPTPLIRATFLEETLGTPAKIYYKYEGVSPSGSHKANTALPQAFYNKKEGITKLSTETGAGQWGSALSFACQHFGLECNVFMVRASFEQKPYRKIMMQTYGGNVVPSPSDKTKIGRELLKDKNNYNGSLGIAISEAVEMAMENNDVHYTLGSVLNHVLLHQTIIGEEARLVLQEIGDYPDIVIACCGGGSNFGGIVIPFLKDNLTKGKKTKFIAVEPTACPTLTKGKYAWDFGDTGKLIPPALMYTLGHTFMPSAVHAGGLRYHGESPLVSYFYHKKLIDAVALQQKEVFEKALLFARYESIIPAPESAHAIATAIDQALICKKTGEKKTILFNLSGHGHFDMSAYDSFLSGKMENYDHPEHKIEESLKDLPKIDFKMG